ncbi:MAG TPA: hypothetical protein VFF02_16035, partial [Anaeromyxobacteraceae bacterium]|nr:hypothetical protein [Anaeromyxobacteraceae bacterium]
GAVAPPAPPGAVAPPAPPRPPVSPTGAGAPMSPEQRYSQVVEHALRKKTLPGDTIKDLNETEEGLTGVSEALAAIRNRPQAFGSYSFIRGLVPGLPAKGEASEFLPDFPFGEAGKAKARAIQSANRDPRDEIARAAVFGPNYRVIRALAGTAVTGSERTDIRSFLPGPNDTARDMEAKLVSLYEWARRRRAQIRTPLNAILPSIDLNDFPAEGIRLGKGGAASALDEAMRRFR